jgi:predicted Rossmann-fold nucleotide-binding protein
MDTFDATARASQELGVRGLQQSLRWLEGLPFVTIYGGSQIKPGTRLYGTAFEFGVRLGQAGIPGTTGGGPGGMEAVNRGLQEGGSLSFGLGMPFKHEGIIADKGNAFLDLYLAHETFKSRKSAFHRAKIKVCLPGGIGTWDELFEELVQCQRNFCHCDSTEEHAPIIFVDTPEYGLYRRLVNLIAGSDDGLPSMLSLGLVDAEHQRLFQLVEDTPHESALEIAARMVIDYWQQHNLPVYCTPPRSGRAIQLDELTRLIQGDPPQMTPTLLDVAAS